MSFNAASMCKASSGLVRIWCYETEDNLASLEAYGGVTSDYFKNANNLSGMGVREGDTILAVNSSTKIVTMLGVVSAGPTTVTVQANAGSEITS